MIQLLKDKSLQDSLDTNGVVKVPFLNEEQLKSLRQFYNEVHPNGKLPQAFCNLHMTTWCKDSDYKLSVKEAIKDVFESAYDNIFQDYRSLNHVFIVKKPHNESVFQIHQDWSVVDEQKFPSYNVWVPLYDTTHEDGTMWIVHKSHKIKSNIRGAGELFPDYSSSMEQLRPYMTNYPMKAGEALVFFHSTIHGSPSNLGKKDRIVAAASIIPKETELRILYKKIGGNTIDVYNPDDDFIYGYNELRSESSQRPPHGRLVEKLPSESYKYLAIDKIIDLIK